MFAEKVLNLVSTVFAAQKIHDIRNTLLPVVNYCNKINFGLHSIRIESFIQNFVLCMLTQSKSMKSL